MKKILACIDGSGFSDSVCAHAAWLSGRINAAVELLNVLPYSPERASLSDLSGTIGIDASSELLEQLTQADEVRAQLEQRKGRLILKHAEQRLRAEGVLEITSIKRRGTLTETISELENDAEIIVRNACLVPSDSKIPHSLRRRGKLDQGAGICYQQPAFARDGMPCSYRRP